MAACGRDRYQAGFDVDAWTAQGRGRVAASAVRDSRQWFELLHTSRAYTAAMTAQTAAARTREKTPGAHTQQRNEITKRKSDTVVRGNKGVQAHGMWRREAGTNLRQASAVALVEEPRRAGEAPLACPSWTVVLAALHIGLHQTSTSPA